MVGKMDRFEIWGVPGVEFLNHVFLFNLVDDDVKHVELREDAHLKLSTPFTSSSHCADVIVNVLVLLDEPFVLFFVEFKVVANLISEEFVL